MNRPTGPDWLAPAIGQLQGQGQFPPGDWRPLWLVRDESRAVVLIFPAGDDRPRLVVKLEPSPGERLAREREVLRRLHTGGDHFVGEIPRPLAWGARGNLAWLATDALQGQPLKRRAMWRRDRVISAGADWLLTFHRATGVAWAEGQAGRAAHVQPAVEAYRANYALSPLVERVLAETFEPGPAAGRLPLALRHGDFNTANVLWRAGRVAVMDWELCTGPDPAGPDLVTWLYSCQPGKPRDVERRMRRAFFTLGPAARAARRYFDALGVGPVLRWPLFLLGWITQANDKRAWLPDDFAVLDDATANRDFGLTYISRGQCLNVELACAWQAEFAV